MGYNGPPPPPGFLRAWWYPPNTVGSESITLWWSAVNEIAKDFGIDCEDELFKEICIENRDPGIFYFRKPPVPPPPPQSRDIRPVNSTIYQERR